MVIRNHIAYRFLTDDNLAMEIVESTYPVEFKTLLNSEKFDVPDKIHSLYYLVCNKDQVPYIVTDSVIKHLDLLKINKVGNHFDWTYFKHLKNQKVTFIMPNNICIRMVIHDEIISFFHLKFVYSNKKTSEGNMKWVMYYLNRNTGELCEHFEHQDVKDIEEDVYKFLCFFYLSENQEEIIQPKKVYGTRKSGKISNDFNFPITVVNSKWNITVIRTDGFAVRGHFAVRWAGEGRNTARIVFIEPFEKEGYIRKAKSIQIN